MSLERAVHRLTGEQAAWLGLDAGCLAVGKRADLVVLRGSLAAAVHHPSRS